MDAETIAKIIKQNKDVPFVERLINKDKYPSIPWTTPEGKLGSATHQMSWGESGGKYFVFPQIEIINGKLIDLETAGIDPFKYALDSNNFISFDNAEDAADFSENYKTGFPTGYFNNPSGVGLGMPQRK